MSAEPLRNDPPAPDNNPAAQSIGAPISHNLLGQRLGRKGQETRERILTAALRLLELEAGPITLTSVAREATIGMTNLYLYFSDIGEVVLAALDRVMECVDVEFAYKLRDHWPDDALDRCSLDLVWAHYRFFQRHARILHLRNSFADDNDTRFVEYRNKTTLPLRNMLVMQMEGNLGGPRDDCLNLANVLTIGFERVATVVTNANFHTTAKDFVQGNEADYIGELITAEARLIEMVVRQQREVSRRALRAQLAS